MEYAVDMKNVGAHHLFDWVSCNEQSSTVCLRAEQFRDGTAAKSPVCRDAAAAREIDVKAAVARLAKLAAISEMRLETLQLQAEGSRIGQLGVSSGGIMGEFGVVHKFCSESHPC